MASPLVAPPVARTQSLTCPNCGGPVELRGFGHALTAVCPLCLSVLDTSTAILQIVGRIQENQRSNPKIPLGTRGKMDGVTWETIGYQTRSVREADGSSYSWDEYLLFNPYHGFRYLTEYEGHWNLVKPLEALPLRKPVGTRPDVMLNGRRFRHFSGVYAKTSFVLGEFPWRVKVGERVLCDDYVDPPAILSSETTDDEVTWSEGEYTQGAEIWKAFALPGGAPKPAGEFLNQPSPYTGQVASVWKIFALMVLFLVILAIGFAAFGGERTILDQTYRFSTADKADPSFVTKVFDLEGRKAAMELIVRTNVDNNWAYFNFALINDDTGQAYDFGREVSYYYGRDSDGSWSEGSTASSVFIPAVAPGHYYLRVEPEMEVPAASTRPSPVRSGTVPGNAVSYEIILKHAVPNYSLFWLAALLLLVPPIWISIRARRFEAIRWSESDHLPPGIGG